MTTDVYPRLAFAREIGHTHQSRLDFQVRSLVSLCAPRCLVFVKLAKIHRFSLQPATWRVTSLTKSRHSRPQGLTGRWPECLHGSLHFVAAQPTRADRAVIAMPLTATPSRPRRERHRLPVCLSVALVQALIGAPSSAPLPRQLHVAESLAPRSQLSSFPELSAPLSALPKLCSEFRVQSLNCEQSALLLPLLTFLLSCSSPSLQGI
jgi:hypothetical protein